MRVFYCPNLTITRYFWTMNFRLVLPLLFGVCSLPSLSHSQSIDTSEVPVWIDMMQDPEANFYETQRAFNLYWEGRERQPGDGWKVFKRWEDKTEKIINPDGSLPAPGSLAEAFEQWRINQLQSAQGIDSEGGEWIEIGPIDKPLNGTGQPNGNGRLNTICFHPTSNDTLWVGAPSGGLWKSTDGGITWSSNTDQLATLGVSSILVNPTNTNIMYIGTGDRDAGDSPGRGVYKSVDGGQNWSTSNSGMGNKKVGAMLMHPSNPDYLIAATSGGIYRSTNAGSTWTLESVSANFKDLKYQPGNPNVVYASETSSGAGFYRSTDGGDSWTEITSGLPSNPQRYAIGVSEDDTSAVYLLCSISSAFGGLYKSTDGGLTFSTQSTTPNIMGWAESGNSGGGQGWYDLAIAVDPNDASTVYCGGVNIWKSTNSGVSWDCVAHWVGSSTAAAVHADQHWFAFSPVNDQLYSCNDGGLHTTANGGETWTELSAGLGIGQIYKIGVSQQTHAMVINGYQDNGTAIWDDTLFRTERGGDGMECIIDYSDDDVVYASVYYGNIVRSFNNGVSFGSFAANNTNGITESGAWVTPYILDKDNPNVMFIGYKNIWRTETAKSSNVSFTAISNTLAGSNSSNMRQLRQSKIDGNRLFAIRSDNKFFRSDNALSSNPTWIDLTSLLPVSSTLRDVETDPFDHNTLYISLGNDIYKSTNAGVSWTNISGTLPNIPFYTIVADPLSNGGIYIAGYAGIYYTDNELSDWVDFMDDFPANVPVRELEIYHPVGNWEARRIRAASYGRGLWESDLYDPGTYAPMPLMVIEPNQVDLCGGDTVDLISNTAYGVDSIKWMINPSEGFSFVAGTADTSSHARLVFTSTGSYDVALAAYNANGSDTLAYEDTILVIDGITVPWFDDFEDNTPCASGGCQTSCDVVSWENKSNGTQDDIDWRPDNYGTPWSAANYNGANTGPSLDYDPGDSSGMYMYISSYPPYTTCYNQVAYLESPCILLDSLTSPEFKFAYHMFGNNGSFNELEVDIQSNGNWVNLWSEDGNHGDQWNLDSINLSSYIGQSVKLRFVGNSGNGWQADIAIDGVAITAAPLANFAVSDSMPCAGDVVQLTDLSTQSPTSWTWTISPSSFSYTNGTNANSQHPEIQFHQAGTYSIILAAYNAYGNDSEIRLGYIEVSKPDASMLFEEEDLSHCADAPFIATASDSTLNNYEFYLNGQLVQSGSSHQLTWPNPANGDACYLVASDSMSCQSMSDTAMLTVFEAHPIGLASSDEDFEICQGDTVTFTVSGNGIDTVAFIQSGVFAQHDTSFQWITNALTDQDSIYAVGYDSNECPNVSSIMAFTVLPIPATPNIEYLFDSLKCDLPADMYRWKHEDSVFISDQVIHQSELGTYRVRIFEGGCWSHWSTPYLLTGFDELAQLQLKVYPSPASAFINLEWQHAGPAEQVTVRLINQAGQLIQVSNEIVLQQGNAHQINLDGLPVGVYHIIVSAKDRTFAIPFVKERR